MGSLTPRPISRPSPGLELQVDYNHYSAHAESFKSSYKNRYQIPTVFFSNTI